jgi:parvulin-like peptidyl-prolyl isomerase
MRRYFISLAVVTSLFAATLSAKDYATVNGEKIDDSDIKAILAVAPGVEFDKLPKEQQKRVIEQAIEKKILSENAIKSGIEKDPLYKSTLEKMKKELALEIWMKKEFDSIKVDEKEMREFYKKNSKMFNQPESVKAKHILLKSEKDAKEVIKELSKAKDLKSEFVKLAAKKSTGPSGPNGGELGWFDRTKMVKPFSDAAFKLKKGEITKKPVKTQFGWHVIYVEDKKKASTVPFEKAKKSIEQTLKVQKFQKHMREVSKALKAKADIKFK